MTAKLNQILAVEKGVKAQNYGKIGEIDKTLQKSDLFNGFHKEYHKVNEENEDLPAESKRVQKTVRYELRQVISLSIEWWNLTATKDWTNCEAKASIILDGGTDNEHTLQNDVPVTYLLFLEKQLIDLRTMAGRLPTLDESENWTHDANAGLYKSGVVKTHRTKKVPRVLTLTPTTEHHPGTAQVYTDDIIAGHWHTTRHSGAMRKSDREKLLERIDRLLKAVKQAREEANGIEVTDEPRIGEVLFDYLTEGLV